MARKIEVQLVGDSRSLERSFARAQGAGSKLGSGIRKLGLAAAAGAAVLGTGLVIGAKRAVDAASNLEEQMNKTRVVFRGSEKSIIRWSETTADSFGISQRAALEAAGTFGNMLVPMGLSRKEAGKMSTAMVELAADMASFNNASPEETLDALRAGLAGETEPLRRFGVFLNEARIKAEAVNMGLAKQGEELTAAEKALATYNIIMKDTKDTQGDFARTSDSLANMQRKVKAQVEDLAASLGRRLLPVVSEVVGRFSDFLARLSAAKGFKARLRIVWLGVSTAVKELYDALRDAMFGSREALKLPSGQIIEWTETQGLVDRLGEALRGVDWATVGATIGRNISTKVKVTAEFIGRILETAHRFVDSHINEFAELGAKMLLAILTKLTDPGFWRENWRLVGAIAIAVFPIGRFFALGGRLAAALVRPVLRLVPNAFKTAAGLAVRAMGPIVSFIVGRFQAALARIPGWLRAAFKVSIVVSAVEAIRNALNRLGDAVRNTVDRIREIWSRVPGIIRTAVSAFAPIIGQLQTVWGWIRSVIGAIDSLASKIRSLPSLPDITPGFNVPFVGHDGGVVPGRRGQTVPALLKAGETVLPTHKGSMGGASAVVVPVYLDGRMIAEATFDPMRNKAAQFKRTNGKAAF